MSGQDSPSGTTTGSKPEKPETESVPALKADIESTRADMSATMSALEARLSPKEIREKVGDELAYVETKVRQVVHEQLVEAKALVREELVEAKKLIGEQISGAEDKVRKGLVEARETLKEDLHDAISGAKASIRAATVGKVEDLATQLGDTMNDTRETLMDTIRHNPVPATLAGIGLAWLLMNRSSSARRGQGSRGYEHGHSGARDWMGDAQRATARATTQVANDVGAAVGGAAHQVGAAVGGAAHQATDAATDVLHQASETASAAMHGASALVHTAGDKASEMAQGAGRQAWRMEQGIETALHENPLAIGAAALVAGAALGFALPRTQREDAMMGETRDRLVTRAEGAAHDAASAVTRATEKSADEAKRLLAASSTPSH